MGIHMQSEKLSFKGHNGSTLSARFDRPDGTMRACALFAHCFTCSKDILSAKRISSRLASMGIGVFRFDFTGLGNSEGDFSDTNFTTNVGDLKLAASYMEHNFQAPSLLIGHSLGGAAVLCLASHVTSAKAIVTIGAPADPEHVLNGFAGSLPQINADGHADVSLAGRPFVIKKQFVEDAVEVDVLSHIAHMHKALLVLHAPKDTQVGIENAEKIFVAARHPKSFVSLDNADHLITNQADAEYIAELIAAWAGRYVDMAEDIKPIDSPEGVVRVSEVDPKGFIQQVTIDGRHRLIADEPKSVGGDNLGATPYQFLSTALGACTTMTIRMYARRKKIDLEHVSVDVTHNKDYASESSDATQKVDVFKRQITLRGNLSSDERQRLLEIADKCPVHRTLHGDVEVFTSLNESSKRSL